MQTAPHATKQALSPSAIIRFDYTLRIEGDGKVRETTNADAARAAGIFREGKRYAPISVMTGIQQIIPGLEAYLLENHEVGARSSVDVPAEMAYGPRRPFASVPIAKFGKGAKEQLQIGTQVNVEGQPGIVCKIGGGRVQVDMNHELAGKTLCYEIIVREVLENGQPYAEALASLVFGQPMPLTFDTDRIVVQVPKNVAFHQTLPQVKMNFAVRVHSKMGMGVRYVEDYPMPPPPPAPTPASPVPPDPVEGPQPTTKEN